MTEALERLSDRVSGVGAEDVLHRHDGRPISTLRRGDLRPVPQFLGWRRGQVFRGRPVD